MSGSSPSELILERNRAFARGDFGFVFDSYHSDSNFRRQFDNRDEYVQVGATSLSQDFEILGCQILAEKVDNSDAQVIFLMEMNAQGQLQKYAELAWLQLEEGAWRYRCAQKITHDELPANPEALSFTDFAKLDPSTIF